MAASPPPQSTIWLRHQDPPRLWPLMLALSGLAHLLLLIVLWPLMIRLDSQVGTTEIIPIELLETIPEADVSLSEVEANSASPLSEQTVLPTTSEPIQSSKETTSLNSEPPPLQNQSPDPTPSPPQSSNPPPLQNSGLNPTPSPSHSSSPPLLQNSGLNPTPSPPQNPSPPPPPPNRVSTGDQIGVSLRLETRGRDIPPVMAQPVSQHTFPLDQITVLISCPPPSPEILQQFSGKKVSIPVLVTDTGQSLVLEDHWKVRSSNVDYDAFCMCLVENWSFSPAQGEQGEPIDSDYLISLTVTVN